MAREPARPPDRDEDNDSPAEVSRTQPRVHRRYTIHDVAAKTGVPHRRIRFFVELGILDPPLGYGRGAVYTDDHIHDVRELERWRLEKRARPAAVRAAFQKAAKEGTTLDLPPQPRDPDLRLRRRPS